MTEIAPAPRDSNAEKRSAAAWSMAASAGMTIAKLVAGLATGSLGLLSEAAHNLLDFGATAITYAAILIAERPADTRHKYGHAKVESVAALIEAGLLLATAVGVIVEAVRRLTGHEAVVTPTWWAFVLLLLSIAIDFFRARSLNAVATRTNSAALEADALHFTADMVSSLAVLAGLALTSLGQAWADAAAALLVAGFIGHAGWELGGRTIDTLMDAAPEGVIERIEAAGRATQGVLRLERVRARPSGATLFVDAEVAVPRTLPFDRASRVNDDLAAALRRELPQADISLVLLPVELDDETAFDKVMLVASRQGVAVHHVTMQHLGGKTAVSFDLEVDGAMPLAAAHAVATRLEDAIAAELGAGIEVESHIEPMQVAALEGEDAPEAERIRIAALLSDLASGLAAGDGRIGDIHDVRARTTPQGLFVTMHCHASATASVQAVHDALQELEARFQAKMPEVKRLIGHAEP